MPHKRIKKDNPKYNEDVTSIKEIVRQIYMSTPVKFSNIFDPADPNMPENIAHLYPVVIRDANMTDTI